MRCDSSTAMDSAYLAKIERLSSISSDPYVGPAVQVNTLAVRVELLSCSRCRPDKGTRRSSRACSLAIALHTTSTGAGAFGFSIGLDDGV